VPPPVPHAVACVPGWQVPEASQQPEAHVVALQTTGMTHAWAVQVWFPPQAEHAAPPVPQAADVVPSWQLPVASQHPVGHVVALQVTGVVHAWAVHVCVPVQAEQLAPPLPQAVAAVPVWQVPVASQQPEQFAELQVAALTQA